MSQTTMGPTSDVGETSTRRPPKKSGKGGMEKLLDTVERVGNKVPHPAIIFAILIGIVIVLSHVFYLMGASVTYETINSETHAVEMTTTLAQSLLTAEGVRFMFENVVQNFMDFNAVGVIIVAMLGVGVADSAGLVRSPDPQARDGRAEEGADVHPGLRRHPLEHRGRRRLPGLDPARGERLPAASGETRSPALRRPSPASRRCSA